MKIARCEYIPVDFSQQNQRRYWGIYNDPGNRVNTKDMVREKVIKGWPVFQDEQIVWANGLSVESRGEGLILVKESNKTVNKYGHQTGAFYCTPKGVEVTGWGIKPKEITMKFKRTWATWSVLYSGQEDEMELQLKLLKNHHIRIYDLENPDNFTEQRVDKNGMIDLSISQPADYLFLRYVIVDL